MVRSYDNNGNLGSEINTIYTNGKVIDTVTTYSNYGGNHQVSIQNVTVRDQIGRAHV